MSFSWVFFEIFLNAFDAFYLLSFPTVKCGRKDWVIKREVFYYWLFFVIMLSFVNFSTDFSFISVYVSPTLALLYVLIFIKGKVFHRVLWMIVPYVILVMIEISTSYLFGYVVGISPEMTFGPNIYHLQAALLCKFFDLAFCLLILRSSKIDLERNSSFISLNIVFLLAITLIFIARNIDNMFLPSFIFFIPIIMLFVNFFYYISQMKVNMKKQEEFMCKLNMLQTEFELQKKEIRSEVQKDLERSYYQKVMSIYETYEGFREKILELMQYAWGKNAKDNNLDPFLQVNRNLILNQPTGYYLIDMTLNVVMYQAANNSIALEVQTKIDSDAIADADDICVILDDLANEAIRILRKIEDIELIKTIKITMFSDSAYLNIIFEYPVNHESSYKIYDSTKYAGKGEGWNITLEIVSRRQGNVSVEDHDYYLTIVIRLPLPISGKVYTTTFNEERRCKG